MVNSYLIHYGVKGMKWGVRKESEYSKRRKFRNFAGNISGHYKRNRNNVDLPKNAEEARNRGWKRSNQRLASMHQHYTSDGVPNQKWVDANGKREVIFSGKGSNQRINRHPEDEGSYNYYNVKYRPIGHTLVDVMPYLLFGNSAKDNTTIKKRVGRSYEAFRYQSVDRIDKDIQKIGKYAVKKQLME